MLIGGLAVIKWGRPRTTQDIDVIIMIEDKYIEQFTSTLTSAGYEIKSSELRQAISEKSHITIFIPNEIVRVDMKGVYSQLDHKSFRNKIKTPIFDVETWIETPEDLIIAKLVFNSYQDLEDAASVFLRQAGKLDMKYIKERALQEKITKRLDKLLKKTSQST
jgi:Nucleotidyltransferase of unknown function (DUF6036)